MQIPLGVLQVMKQHRITDKGNKESQGGSRKPCRHDVVVKRIQIKERGEGKATMPINNTSKVN